MQAIATSAGIHHAPTAGKLSITAIILTFDEEIHIERCLSRIMPLVERVVVVDSFSTDRTVEIARALGAEVLQRRFKHQADQFQWALDNCEIRSDWVLRLDADEYLEPPLMEEIRLKLPRLPTAVTGVNLRRKVIFRDTWIRHGGYYPSIFLRIWRNGVGKIEQRWMDEHAVLAHGETVTLLGDFVDHNLRDITWWTEKHNRFTTRQMVDFINLEHGLLRIENSLEPGANSPGSRKRFLRNKVYARAPLYLRGVLYFLVRYVFRLGFLDGRQGFVFHFLQGCWNMMLIDAKIDEARAFIKENGIEAFRHRLKTQYGVEV